RRARQLALAALWLLDAVRQCQTFLFVNGSPECSRQPRRACSAPPGRVPPDHDGGGHRRPADLYAFSAGSPHGRPPPPPRGGPRGGRMGLFLRGRAALRWVGGQRTLAARVPVLRRLGAEIPRAAARRFNQVAWPAFAVLVVTGIWNIAAVHAQVHGSYETTL